MQTGQVCNGVNYKSKSFVVELSAFPGACSGLFLLDFGAAGNAGREYTGKAPHIYAKTLAVELQVVIYEIRESTGR
jgi:hypothetical protein